MVLGKSAFVLPSFSNTPYIDIMIGDLFGMMDIVGSQQTQNFEIDEWY